MFESQSLQRSGCKASGAACHSNSFHRGVGVIFAAQHSTKKSTKRRLAGTLSSWQEKAASASAAGMEG